MKRYLWAALPVLSLAFSLAWMTEANSVAPAGQNSFAAIVSPLTVIESVNAGTFAEPRLIEEAASIGAVFVDGFDKPSAFYMATFASEPGTANPAFPKAPHSDESWTYAGQHSGVGPDLKPFDEPTRVGALHGTQIEGKKALLVSKIDGVPDAATPYPETAQSNDFWEFIGLYEEAGDIEHMKSAADLVWPGVFVKFEPGSKVYVALRTGYPLADEWPQPDGEDSAGYWQYAGTDSGIALHEPKPWTERSRKEGSLFQESESPLRRYFFASTFKGFPALAGARFPEAGESDQNWAYQSRHAGSALDPVAFGEPTAEGRDHRALIQGKWALLHPRFEGPATADTPYPRTLESNEFWDLRRVSSHAGTWQDPRGSEFEQSWTSIGEIHAIEHEEGRTFYRLISTRLPWDGKWDFTDTSIWQPLGLSRHAGTIADPKRQDELTWPGAVHVTTINNEPAYFASLVEGFPIEHDWPLPTVAVSTEHWVLIPEVKPLGTFETPRRFEDYSQSGSVFVGNDAQGRRSFFISRFEGYPADDIDSFAVVGDSDNYWVYAGHHAGLLTDLKPADEISRVGAIHETTIGGQRALLRSRFEGWPSAATPLPTTLASNEYWEFIDVFKNAGTVADPKGRDDVTWPGALHLDEDQQLLFAATKSGKPDSEGWIYPPGQTSDDNWTFVSSLSGGTPDAPRERNAPSTPGTVFADQRGLTSQKLYRAKFTGFAEDVGAVYPQDSDTNVFYDYIGEHAGTFADPKGFDEPTWPGAIHQASIEGQLAFLTSKIEGRPDETTPYPDRLTSNDFWQIEFTTPQAGTFTDPKSMQGRTWPGAIHKYVDGEATWLAKALRFGDPEADQWPMPQDETYWEVIGTVIHDGSFAEPKTFNEATAPGLIHADIIDGQTAYFRSLINGVPQPDWSYPAPGTHNEHWQYLGRNLPEGSWADPKGTSGFTWPGRIHSVHLGTRHLYLMSKVDGILAENDWPLPDSGDNEFWSVVGESVHQGNYTDPKGQQEVTWAGAIHMKQSDHRMYYESLISANLADAASNYPLPADYESNEWWRYTGHGVSAGTLNSPLRNGEVAWPGAIHGFTSIADYYYRARFAGVIDSVHAHPYPTSSGTSNEHWEFLAKRYLPGTYEAPKDLFEVTSPGAIHDVKYRGERHYYRSKISGVPGPTGWHYPTPPVSNEEWDYVDTGINAGTWSDPKPWTDNSWPGAIYEYRGPSLKADNARRQYFKSRFLGKPAEHSESFLDSAAWEPFSASPQAGTLDDPMVIEPGKELTTWRGGVHFDPRTSHLVEARQNGRIGFGLEVNIPPNEPVSTHSWTYLGVHRNEGTVAAPKEWDEYTWAGRIHRADHDGKALYFRALAAGTPSEKGWAYPVGEASNEHWAFIGTSHQGTYQDPNQWGDLTWPGAIHRVEREDLLVYYSAKFSGNAEQLNRPYPSSDEDTAYWAYAGTVQHAGTVVDPRTTTEPVWPGVLVKSEIYYYTAMSQGIPDKNSWDLPEGRNSNEHWTFYGASTHAGTRTDPKEWTEVTWPGAIHSDRDSAAELRLYVSLVAGVPANEGWTYPSGWHGNNWWSFDSAQPGGGTFDAPLGWNALTVPGLIHVGSVDTQYMAFASKFSGRARPENTPPDDPGKVFPDGAMNNQWWDFMRKGNGADVPNVWSDYSITGDTNIYYHHGERFVFRAKRDGRPSSHNWFYPTSAVDNKYWEYLYKHPGTLAEPKEWDELTYPGAVHRYERGSNVLFFRAHHDGNPADHNWYYPTRPVSNDDWTYIGKHSGSWQDPKAWSEPTWPGAIHQSDKYFFVSKVEGTPSDHNWYYPTRAESNAEWDYINTGRSAAPGINDFSQPFDRYTWVTAHNAYLDNLQGHFNRGIRGFMIDVHMHGNSVRVCHSSDASCSENDPLFKNVLLQLLSFLEQDRNAVISVLLESTITEEKMLEVLKEIPQIAKYVSSSGPGREWPTLQEIVNTNKRMIMFSDGKTSGTYKLSKDEEPLVEVVILSALGHHVENTYNLGDTALTHDWSCKSRHNSLDLSLERFHTSHKRLFVLNQFHAWGSSTWHAGDRDNNLTWLQRRVEQYCGAPSGWRKPNYLAIDFNQVGDAFPYAAALSQGGFYFYEETYANREYDTTCVLPANQHTGPNGIQYDIGLGARGCENDEIKSIEMEGIRAGTRIEFYDHPEGDRQDDFTIIDVKQSIPMGKRVRVDSLEGSQDSFYFRKVASHNNGLNGSVSRIIVRKTPAVDDITDALIVFHEGNGGTENIVCSVPFDRDRQFKMGRGNNDYGCDNDEIRSARVIKAGKGSIFSVVGNPDGSFSQGRAGVTFKRNINKPITIGSFNRSYENDDVKVEVSHGGDLDGWISYAYFRPDSEPEPPPEEEPEPEPDPGAPAPPGHISFENQWARPLTIVWDKSPYAVKYQVYQWLTKIAETTDNHFQVSPTKYSRFHVRAVDSRGRLSGPSAHLFFYPEESD